MKIILGVFGQSYDDLRDEHDAIAFDENDWLENESLHLKNPFIRSLILHNVCHNLDACSQCIFDVTHLRLPFTENVITLRELHVVIHNDEYFNKTEFYVQSQIINKNKLKELFLINEPIEFKDYAELFNH